MSDLIRPLRAVAAGGSGDINLLAARAADEIERLEGSNEVLDVMAEVGFGSTMKKGANAALFRAALEEILHLPGTATLPHAWDIAAAALSTTERGPR